MRFTVRAAFQGPEKYMPRQSDTEPDSAARARGWPAAPFVAALVLILAACHTDRQAAETAGMLGRAATALDVARTEETKRYAAAELAIAEEKLAQARNAARQEEFDTAERLVSESLVNVHLATSKAEAARIRAELERRKASPAAAGERRS